MKDLNVPITIPHLMRQKEVLKYVGVSRQTLWKWQKNGCFPKAKRLGPKLGVWPSQVILKFLKSKGMRFDTEAEQQKKASV